jgi:hypothetical protein
VSIINLIGKYSGVWKMAALNANDQQSQEISSTRTWYLDDRPLESFERVDHFRHRAYVEVLLQAIRELSPPFTVGIFGSWGIGKTSIANDLRHSIKSHEEFKEIPIVSIDVWKYGGDSLRRQFLWDAQETLKKEKVLRKNYDIIKKLYKERKTEIESEPRFSFHRLKNLWPFLLASFFVTFAALWLFIQLGIATPLQALAVSLVVPILLLFIPEFLRKVVVQQKGAEIEPRLFSAEQFEQAFEDMILKAKCNKIVILIDNLDRCSHERVAETLSVVKTYLEPKGKKCIFVIPCDDAAIKQHLEIVYHAESGGKAGPGEHADEYLRKFFNTSIRIGPFIQTEIEPYIADLLGRIRLTEGMSEDNVKRMVQLIGAAFTENPRRIKQFLNNLTAKYLLVKEREADPYLLISPPISGKLLFLAKVSVIEAKFPEEFAEFVADDNLYGEVSLALEPGKTGSEEANNILKNNPKLRQFLLATRDITAPNPKAFFHLKQSRQEMDIPNYDEFLNAVRAGDRELVQSLFDKGDDRTNGAQCEEIRSQIRANVERGYYNYVISAIDVAGAIVDKVSDERKITLAQDVIGVIALEEGVKRMLALLKPEEIFSLVPKASQHDRRLVLDEYITLYSLEPEAAPVEGVDTHALQLSIAETMVKNLELFSPAQRKRVKEATSSLKSPSPVLLLAISSTDDAKSDLVAPALIIKSIEELKTEEVASFVQSPESKERHFESIEFILRCQDIAGGDAGGLWTKKCVELLELAAKENNPGLQEYTHRCIDSSEALWSKSPTESVDQLAHLLREQYPQASQDRRLEIVLTLSAMQEHCSEGEKNKIKNLILGQFIQSEPPGNVSRFLAAHADKNNEDLPYHQQAFEHLAQRVVSEGSKDVRLEILRSLLNIDGSRRTDLLLNLLVSLIVRPELQVAIPLVREVSSEFPKGPQGKNLVAPLLNKILNRSREQVSTSDRKMLLELAIYLKEWHTRQFQDEFDSFVAELLTSTDPTMREVGLETMTSAESEGVITEDRRKQILRQVSDWLTQGRPQPDGPMMKELALVVGAKENILSVDLQSNLIEYLRAMATPQTPPDYRRGAFRHLSSFIGVQRDLLEGLVPELIGYAESEGDANMRGEIEESLLSLRTGNMPLDRDLWDDSYRYIRALMANADPERQKRGRQLYQRMKQITRDVRKRTRL